MFSLSVRPTLKLLIPLSFFFYTIEYESVRKKLCLPILTTRWCWVGKTSEKFFPFYQRNDAISCWTKSMTNWFTSPTSLQSSWPPHTSQFYSVSAIKCHTHNRQGQHLFFDSICTLSTLIDLNSTLLWNPWSVRGKIDKFRWPNIISMSHLFFFGLVFVLDFWRAEDLPLTSVVENWRFNCESTCALWFFGEPKI